MRRRTVEIAASPAAGRNNMGDLELHLSASTQKGGTRREIAASSAAGRNDTFITSGVPAGRQRYGGNFILTGENDGVRLCKCI